MVTQYIISGYLVIESLFIFLIQTMQQKEEGEKEVQEWTKISLIKWGNPSVVTKDDKDKDGVKEEREKILDKICTPKEWWGAGQFWRQHLSAEPVNRLDVMELSEEFDLLLNEHCVRDTSICDIRQHIYSQLFNEVCRQITLYCVQQGSLLVRIRDDIWMMQAFYKKMYQNSLSFIFRKTVEVVERKNELEYVLEKLRMKKEDKEKELINLTQLIKSKEEIMASCREEAEENHNKEVQKLENIKNAHKKQLKTNLEAVITTKPK